MNVIIEGTDGSQQFIKIKGRVQTIQKSSPKVVSKVAPNKLIIVETSTREYRYKGSHQKIPVFKETWSREYYIPWKKE